MKQFLFLFGAVLSLSACSGINQAKYVPPDSVSQNRPYTIDPGYDPVGERERARMDVWERLNQ